jgi:hypothetical protein
MVDAAGAVSERRIRRWRSVAEKRRIVGLSDHLRLTREELYRLVWAKPMTEVGQDFQISDRAMAKICARKQVPVPPRGYWAKKNAARAY